MSEIGFLTLGDRKRIPGYNVDGVDIEAGLKELLDCGYDDMHTREVIRYALLRHQRGEEEAAQRGAIDQSFHGINLTSWYRVLAAARAAYEVKHTTPTCT